MLKVPSHISKTRNGTYYFRLVIPKNLREQLNYKREFTRTLKTENKHTAIKRARVLMVEMDKVLAFLEAKKRGETPSQGWIELSGVELKDGTKIDKAIIDQETPEQERETINELFNTNSAMEASNFPEILLSEVSDKFCDERIALNEWANKTAVEVKATLALFKRIVGDVSFASLKYGQLRDYKDKILKLPPNINKDRRYRDNTINEILQMPDVKPMARVTLRTHLSRVSSLFEWAVKTGYTDNNYASGFTIKKDKKAQDERCIYTNTDLKKIFESPDYLEHKFKYNYQYWIPLIALYSGARLTEICQLYLADIKLEDEVYVFDINDRQDKKLKNSSSKRLIPIHSKLIELGIITYANQLKLSNEKRLFPEIKCSRDGYGQIVSRWFGRYRKKVGIEEPGKVFHSFRHTFIDGLKQIEVSKEIVSDIAGHADGSETFGRYGKNYQPKVQQQYIEMLKFDFKHPQFYKV